MKIELKLEILICHRNREFQCRNKNISQQVVFWTIVLHVFEAATCRSILADIWDDSFFVSYMNM